MDVPRRSEADQKAFFDLTLARALDAESRVGARSFYFDVAGTVVRIVFAGDRLVPDFVPALAHLQTGEPAQAQVTFHVWDSATTGVAMPPSPCDRSHLTNRGDIWGFTGQRYRLAFHWIECSVNVMDRSRREAVYWVETADTLPYWTKASPLRTLFHWWMEMNGRQLLHAAAVGRADGAILITGKGGVGKSTTALAALAHGMSYIADDYLIVGLDPAPTVYSLYSTAKLNPDNVARFPKFAPHVTNLRAGGEEKAVMQLYPAFAPQIARALPLRAIATPRITGRTETTFEPIGCDVLHKAAAFTTMSQLPYAGRHTHDFIGRMRALVPGHALALGHDLAGVVRALAAELTQPTPVRPQPKAQGAEPLVTVIVPVYNGARFLHEAIANILAQDYPAIEIIVVDDGSTDEIDQAVATLSTDVRFFKQKNAGPAAARNRGIRDASGEFIAFLDVDDLWPENNLKTLLGVLSTRSDLDVVHGYGQLTEFDPDTGAYEYVGNPRESFPYYIGAALYRRAVFETVGLYDTELQFAEDTDWFNRAMELKVGIERLAQVTLLVRRHGQNTTHGKSLVELNTLRVFKKMLDRKRGRDSAA